MKKLMILILILSASLTSAGTSATDLMTNHVIFSKSTENSGFDVKKRTIPEYSIALNNINDTITNTNHKIHNPNAEKPKFATLSSANTNIHANVNLIIGPPPTPIYWQNFEDPNGNYHFYANGEEFVVPHESFLYNTTIKAIGASGFTNHVLKIAPNSLGEPTGTPPSTTMNLRFGTFISVVKGKTYSVKFKAAADSARTIDVLFTQKFAPFDTVLWIKDIPLDTTLATYGSYLLNWGQNEIQKSARLSMLDNKSLALFSNETASDSLAFEFAVGASLIPVYLDDIEIIEVSAPEINVVQEDSIIEDNSGIYDFGAVEVGSSKSVIFIIENTGTASLNLSEGTPKVTVLSDDGFTLKTDAVSPVASGHSTTFEVLFEPTNIGEATGIISIENNDASENPYNFTIVGLGVSTTATVEIDALNRDIKVYPNPAKNVLKIDVQALQGETVVAEIINMQGHSIITATGNTLNNGVLNIELNLQKVINGAYLINVSINNKLRRTSKIVIQK